MEDRYLAGFTLIELLVTLAVTGIFLAIAVPAMSSFIERKRLVSAAEYLAEDLRFARTETVTSSRPGSIHVAFATKGNQWCYGLDDQPGCDCFNKNSKTRNACSIRLRHSDDFPSVALVASRFSGRSQTWFEKVRGTTRAGYVEFRSVNGQALQVKLSILGRARICVPTTAQLHSGYPQC